MSKQSKGPVRVGIVGLGRAGWGMHRAELAAKQDKFRVVAACDRIDDRLDRAAAEWGCRTYSRVEQLIADADVELVDLAHRSCDHCRDALKALRAGKLVLVEKPMSLTYTQARRLQRASDNGPGRLFVRHNRRFDPDFLHVREIIESGLLGDVYAVKLSRLHYSRRDDWQAIVRFGGGQLLNWGPHVIDHALQLLGSPVKTQWSKLKRIAAAGDAEDYVRVMLTGRTGRVVEIEISGGSALGGPVYLVFGTRGALSCDCRNITLRHLDPARKLPPRKANPRTPEGGYGSPDELHWVEQTFPVAPKQRPNIWDELYAAIRKGRRFPVRLEQAVEVMRVISAAKKGTPFEVAARR